MNNPVLEAISSRRSIRSYKKEKVSQEQLDTLIKAALESPSARNDQPWHFSVVQDSALLKDISDETCKVFKMENEDIFHGAPAAIFLSCEPDSRWGRHDCGIAVENIALAAHSIGLGSVILGFPEGAFTGSRGGEFSKTLKFPSGYAFAICIALGIPAGTKEAHEVKPGLVDFIK